MGGGALIVLDTHTIIWLLATDRALGRRAKETIDREFVADQVAVSAMTFWEVAMLKVKGRITLQDDVASWRSDVLRLGIIEIPITGDIAITAAQLPHFHGDPADRMIAATALVNGATLFTADRLMLTWKSKLRRSDARK